MAEETRIVKTVTFNETPIVYEMVVWSFAYRKARQADWASIVADAFRFKRRCSIVEQDICYIFRNDHRQKMRRYIKDEVNKEHEKSAAVNEPFTPISCKTMTMPPLKKKSPKATLFDRRGLVRPNRFRLRLFIP